MRLYDHTMLFSGKYRNNWYYNQIKTVSRDKVCLDIGTGSGILSLFALHCGAKHVYMVDHNINCCIMAKNILQEAGIDPFRYTIIHTKFDESLVSTLPNIDVVISEVISSNFFDIDLNKIYNIVKNSQQTKNAILVPDTIQGSFNIFSDLDCFDKIDNIRNNYEYLKTGVIEIDDAYNFDVKFFCDDIHLNEKYFIRIFEKKNDTISNLMRELYINSLESHVATLKNVIQYNMHQPYHNYTWKINSDIPNGKYGALLIGEIGCSQIAHSSKHLMNQDVWATYFYKFNKTSNTINIKFDHNKRNFIFSE